MRLTDVKSISSNREKDFNKLNIYTAEQLIRLYPRDFLDLRKVTPLKFAYHNDVLLTACEVLNVETNKYSRHPYVKALCQQQGFLFTAIWFNQPYIISRLKPGNYLFYGRVENKYGMGCRMVNPSFENADNAVRLKGIIPVYPLSGNLTQGAVRTAIKNALSKVDCPSYIPQPIAKKYNLQPLKEAFEKLHSPTSEEDIKRASERIALEEYFLLISAFKVIKGGRDEARLNRYSVTREQLEEFIKRFPFPFTQGQRAAVDEIFENIKSPHIMNRLLQGDVGCGKTAVALAGIFMAVSSGYQAAMIAPTEVLARQNAALIQKYFPDFPVATLTGSTPAAEKRKIKAYIAGGQISIVCGTHALIQDDVEFSNLSFVVCDEQHRFGVAQRSSLTQKGEGCDMLVMSATPIPRTLSLIFYGDLDVTTIKDKPQSRLPITTAIIPERKYDDMFGYVAERAKEGEKTYFVCPRIEGDDEGTLSSVTEIYDEVKRRLPSLKVGLLHGKMKEAEKNRVMEEFKGEGYDCLVSTTVIEVGVDVPEATTIIIYNAERFGLAQLHQLRGRVGRGDKKSYCFLLMGNDSPDSRERLSVIKNSADGFEIAEADLKLRGGGDFMGTRQSGHILTELKNLKFPVSVIFTAKAVSDEAFLRGADENLRKIAAEKYGALKDVILN